MYLIRQLCITLSSILEEGLYDLGFLSRARFEAHTVVEDETWILVGVIAMPDVRCSSAIMGDIDGSLQSCQEQIRSPRVVVCTPSSLLGKLLLKTILKTELTRDDFPTPDYIDVLKHITRV